MVYRIQKGSPMNRIIKIGMDVHSTNYTVCAMEPVLDGEAVTFTVGDAMADVSEILVK